MIAPAAASAAGAAASAAAVAAAASAARGVIATTAIVEIAAAVAASAAATAGGLIPAGVRAAMPLRAKENVDEGSQAILPAPQELPVHGPERAGDRLQGHPSPVPLH